MLSNIHQEFQGRIAEDFQAGSGTEQDSLLHKGAFIAHLQQQFSNLIVHESGQIARSNNPAASLENFVVKLVDGLLEPQMTSVAEFRSLRDLARNNFCRNREAGVATYAQERERHAIDFTLNLTVSRLLDQQMQPAARLAHLKLENPKVNFTEWQEALGRGIRVAVAPIFSELTIFSGDTSGIQSIAPELVDEEKRAYIDGVSKLSLSLRVGRSMNEMIETHRLGAGGSTVFREPEKFSEFLLARESQLYRELSDLEAVLSPSLKS